MTLGERIKTYRQKAGLSQEKTAELIGVSRQAVTKWESGQSAPSTENLFRLAELFGTTVDLLIAPPDHTSQSVAEEMYRLLKSEETQNAAAKRGRLQRNVRMALLAAAGFLLFFLLGRVLWCDLPSSSFVGWLLFDRPAAPRSYLYGWLLSSNLFWLAMAVSVFPALWGKYRFSLTTLGGFWLAWLLGLLLGPTPYGTGEYGWAFWGGVFLLSLIMGAILERLHRRGIPLRSKKGLIWLTAFAAALLLVLLFVHSALPDWQGMPG